MASQAQAHLFHDLLGPLQMHFEVAAQAYADYLQNNKSFLFASSLRRTNASARALLLTHGHLLPRSLRADAVALIRHYDVWLTLWDATATAMKPRFDEPFVFENNVNFPKEAQQRVQDLYVSLASRGTDPV